MKVTKKLLEQTIREVLNEHVQIDEIWSPFKKEEKEEEAVQGFPMSDEFLKAQIPDLATGPVKLDRKGQLSAKTAGEIQSGLRPALYEPGFTSGGKRLKGSVDAEKAAKMGTTVRKSDWKGAGGYSYSEDPETGAYSYTDSKGNKGVAKRGSSQWKAIDLERGDPVAHEKAYAGRQAGKAREAEAGSVAAAQKRLGMSAADVEKTKSGLNVVPMKGLQAAKFKDMSDEDLAAKGYFRPKGEEAEINETYERWGELIK